MQKQETGKKIEPVTSAISILFGGGIALLLILLSILLISGLIWGRVFSPDHPELLLTICAGLCTFLGSRFAVQRGKGQALFSGCMTSVLLCILLILIFFGTRGTLAFPKHMIGVFLMILAGGILAGLMGKKKKRKKRRR